jgi:integrase
MRTGENIYKRKDGRWEARYRKGRGENGRLIYGSCYGRTYTEAKRKIEIAKKEFAPVLPNGKDTIPTFGTVCDEWMRCNHVRLKQSTCVKYRTIIERHIKPSFGGMRISEISTETMGKFGAELLSVSGLSPKTATDILVLARSILEYGARQYPGATSVVEVQYPKRIPKEMRVLTRSEQEILTNYLLANLNPCKFGVLLALWTGIRIGELCALRWNQISIEGQTIKISTTMQRLHNSAPQASARTSIVLDVPKTVSSIRVIPIGNQTTVLCRAIDQGNQNAYVLTGTEMYMEPRLLQYHFQRYVCDCGLKDVTFHTLRHTFATRCVEVGFEIKSLSEILGHANTAITLNRYVHCSLELKRENMNKLEDFTM